MKKPLLLSTIIAFSSFIALTTVASERSAPSSCPKASTVKSVRLNAAKLNKETGNYAAYNINTYGTKQRWVFIIGNIDASSQGDAVTKANEALPTVSNAMKKPHYDSDNELYICVYNVGYGYVAGAITTSDANTAMSELRKFH